MWSYFLRLKTNLGAMICTRCSFSMILSDDPFVKLLQGSIWHVIYVSISVHFTFKTHLIIIIKSEVSNFSMVFFFRGCVFEVVLLSYSVIYYIYIPRRPGLVSIIDAQSMVCKRFDTLWSAGRVRFFLANYTISLSSLRRLIWRHWVNKMLVKYMLSSVCLR